ncbi:MAG: phosphogluconate dehydratase, partial [Alphaproteobacteria bacterium]|nr:phosphogluconate dehydratase [Alphaproteobacteria bacterium]
MPLHPVIADVTARIRSRSGPGRASYLHRIEAAAARGPARAHLACSNAAHAFAAAGTDKDSLAEGRAPNLG